LVGQIVTKVTSGIKPYYCFVIVEYQDTLQHLCRTSTLVVGNDSPSGATSNLSSEKSTAVKLALRTMLRTFPFCATWTLRISRLHAFLAKHCTEYAKNCCAIQPPLSVLSLSSLDSLTDVTQPLVAMEYLGNILTAADGRILACFLMLDLIFVLLPSL